MPRMDNEEVLALFDRQLRRDYRGDGPGDVVERDGGVVRHVGAEQSWCGVIWSDLDEHGADAAIAAQLEYFRGLGRPFEWKLYAHDRPADLGVRLAKAGLVPEEPEALMVAEIDGLPTEPVLPEGVRIERVRDLAGVEQMIAAHRAAFGRPKPRLEEHLRHQVTQNPDGDGGGLTAVVVLAGDEPVCAARMEFHEGTPFASLWGGGTAPGWRGRGIYRATVAYRARLAVERGYRYLQVDASDDSRPILARLGFQALSTTTPYNYEP
jgi:GNAT superfamily N-acetyltransferase